MPRLKKTVF